MTEALSSTPTMVSIDSACLSHLRPMGHMSARRTSTARSRQWICIGHSSTARYWCHAHSKIVSFEARLLQAAASLTADSFAAVSSRTALGEAVPLQIRVGMGVPSLNARGGTNFRRNDSQYRASVDHRLCANVRPRTGVTLTLLEQGSAPPFPGPAQGPDPAPLAPAERPLRPSPLRAFSARRKVGSGIPAVRCQA